jgi:transposase
MVCLFWPPYSPERNPVERLWQEVKAPWAWGVAAAIEAWEHRVARILTHYSQATLRSLTAYPYFVRAVHAVSS